MFESKEYMARVELKCQCVCPQERGFSCLFSLLLFIVICVGNFYSSEGIHGYSFANRDNLHFSNLFQLSLWILWIRALWVIIMNGIVYYEGDILLFVSSSCAGNSAREFGFVCGFRSNSRIVNIVVMKFVQMQLFASNLAPISFYTSVFLRIAWHMSTGRIKCCSFLDYRTKDV